MNILPKISSLPSLLAINVMQKRYRSFKEPCDLKLVIWSKGHVWEPLTLCHHLAYCGVDTSSAGEDMYFICHVTEQDHSVEMSSIFMGEKSLPHVTTLKSVVTIGILIVKRKNASSKKSYKYVLTLKNWVDWITTRQEKNVTNTEMVYFEKKCPEIVFKKTFFPLWLPSITWNGNQLS